MAVPPDFNILNLTGKFIMNKTLSDPHDGILAAQGMGWVTRKTISFATITLHIKHYKDKDDVEHIDIDQTLSGGIKGTREERTLWWKDRETVDPIFGAIVGRTRRVKDLSLVESDDEWLRTGWTPDTFEHGLVESRVESDTPKSNKVWLATQLWGMEEINGERRYSRHVHFTGPDGNIIKARLVYDYDPKPLLNINIHVRNSKFVLPLEILVSKAVRPLNSPWLFAVLVVGYIIGFAFFSRAQSFLTPPSSFIECTSTYWLDKNGCGLDGQQCLPGSTDGTFDFRCPAQCTGVILQNPRTVGNGQMSFVPLIIGGGDDEGTYRGDSFICAAAVQAGKISNSKGGCATLRLIGNYTNFLPLRSHGLTSIGFPTEFPLSWRFEENTPLSSCEDNRDAALALNVIISCLIFVVLRPKPIITFWCLFCIGFWHISLFSQPAASPPPLERAFGIFLPGLFVAYGFWRVAWRFVLPAFAKLPMEGMVLYLGPYWVGVLANMTTERIPISRLLATDIKARSGGIASLVVIIVVVVALAINQIRVIRKTGWLPHYFRWYAIGGLVVLVLSQLPGLVVRIHHYIIAMVLTPGTAFPTKISAILQGLLLGLFLNGIAAFGFDSFLQSPESLVRDAPVGSDLPSLTTNSSNWNPQIPFSNQSITWSPLAEGWSGFSLLVDDVERYSGDALNFSLVALNASIPHFFRLAMTANGTTGDYTKAGTLWPNGTWIDPLPGPS
ncbi:LCCL domain-containing protein [Marasmius fiardii PR-910]|nr:LCCL domain-containing protein [Marasmius fiardii PR-910]